MPCVKELKKKSHEKQPEELLDIMGHSGLPRGTPKHEANLLERNTPFVSSDVFKPSFWPGLGLPSRRPMLSYQKSTLAKIFTPATTLQKRPVKITMYLGLDIIIKLKFTTNFDRCAI